MARKTCSLEKFYHDLLSDDRFTGYHAGKAIIGVRAGYYGTVYDGVWGVWLEGSQITEEECVRMDMLDSIEYEQPSPADALLVLDGHIQQDLINRVANNGDWNFDDEPDEIGFLLEHFVMLSEEQQLELMARMQAYHFTGDVNALDTAQPVAAAWEWDEDATFVPVVPDSERLDLTTFTDAQLRLAQQYIPNALEALTVISRVLCVDADTGDYIIPSDLAAQITDELDRRRVTRLERSA
jgi:hypothetical protein